MGVQREWVFTLRGIILFLWGVAALIAASLYAIKLYSDGSLDPLFSQLGGYSDVATRKVSILIEDLLNEGKKGVDWILASEYGGLFQKVVIGYAGFAVVAPLFPVYREGVRVYLGGLKEQTAVYCILTILYGLSMWAWFTGVDILDHQLDPHTWISGSRGLTLLTGLLLFAIGLYGLFVSFVLGITSVIWLPVLLLVLPGLVVLFASSLLKGVFVGMLFVAKLPLLAWHYLHYLFVPHPAERIILKHEKMRMERGVKIDHAALGEELSTVMYNKEREGLPAWWKSESRRKRLEKLRGRIKVEKDIVDDTTEDIRERNRRERYGPYGFG